MTSSPNAPDLDALIKEQLSPKVENAPDLTEDMHSLLESAPASGSPDLDALIKEQLSSKVDNVPDLTGDMDALMQEHFIEDLSRKILSIPNKKKGRYKPDIQVQFKNSANKCEGYIKFGNILEENWIIITENGKEETFANTDDLLQAGWEMNYTQHDLDGLKRFRNLAKEKANIDEPDRIFLGYKVEKHSIHLYLDDPTPGGKKALGCWHVNRLGIIEYAPPKMEYKGKVYDSRHPLRSDDSKLDDLIVDVIRKRGLK